MAALVDCCFLPPALLLPSTFAQPHQYLVDNTQPSIVELTRQLSEHNLEHGAAQHDSHKNLFSRRWSFEAPASAENALLPSNVISIEGPSAPTSLGATHFPAPSPCSYADHSASSIRRQRQHALRSQCSSSHLQAISALVSRMMEKGEQCTVRSASPEVQEDCNMQPEGETMGQNDEPEICGYRRSTFIHKHSTRSCVAKEGRARKHSQRSLNTAGLTER